MDRSNCLQYNIQPKGDTWKIETPNKFLTPPAPIYVIGANGCHRFDTLPESPWDHKRLPGYWEKVPANQGASVRFFAGLNEIQVFFMTTTLPFGVVTTGLLENYATVFIFILVGFAFAGIALGVAKLLRPSNPSPAKMTTYECGEIPIGSSWVRFNVRFYLVALFFIIFDVEVIFLYPWAVVFKQLYPVAGLGAIVFWEMIIFLAILSLGLAYVWVKGDLNWVKKLAQRSAPDTTSSAVPQEEVPTS